MNETELFDRYLSKEMSDEERQDFDAQLEQDEALRQAFHLHVATLKELGKQADQENAQFGEAMKHIPRDELDEIIGKNAKGRNSAAKIRSLNITWTISVAAVLIIGVFGIRSMKTNYENRNDNLLVEYNAGMVSRGAESGLDALMKNVTDGKELDATTKRLESIYNSDSQDSPVAGWYLALSYIKQHDHSKAIATLKSLEQKYPEFAQSIGVKDLISKLQ
jgi:hypothetical protein